MPSKLERSALHLTQHMPENTTMKERITAIDKLWDIYKIVYRNSSCRGCRTFIKKEVHLFSLIGLPPTYIGRVCYEELLVIAPKLRAASKAALERDDQITNFMTKQMPTRFNGLGLPFTTYAQMKHHEGRTYRAFINLVKSQFSEDELQMYNTYYATQPRKRRKTTRASQCNTVSVSLSSS